MVEKRTVPLFRVYHTTEMETRAVEVLRSGAIAVGKFSEAFSQAFGALTGQPHVVTTSDMSNALLLALRVAGVGKGDEVLTTPFACMSTNGPIAMAGAQPAWVDVDPGTATLDLDSLKRSVNKRCKALILYHVAGYPGPVEEVAAFCRECGITLIEDCDNALLATVDGVQVGQWGDFAIFSFYPNRQVNASEGGAIACRSGEGAGLAIRLRRLGIDLPRFRTPDGEIDPKCDIPEIGIAATMNNLCSALGLEQVPTVHSRIQTARTHAHAYRNLLARSKVVWPVDVLPGADPSYWGFLVRSIHRDDLLVHLKRLGVGASKLHYLNTRYSGFNASPGVLRGSSELMSTILALPCGWWMDETDVDYVCSCLESFSPAGT